jgi:hypothetical protein
MPLNKEGIAQLKADLRADVRRYDQDTYGEPRFMAGCGTVCCMAGACLRRETGAEEFDRRVMALDHDDGDGWNYEQFVAACVAATVRQLGIKFDLARCCTVSRTPRIFCVPYHWPADLRRDYMSAANVDDHQALVEVACRALDRMDEYGNIDLEATDAA